MSERDFTRRQLRKSPDHFAVVDPARLERDINRQRRLEANAAQTAEDSANTGTAPIPPINSTPTTTPAPNLCLSSDDDDVFINPFQYSQKFDSTITLSSDSEVDINSTLIKKTEFWSASDSDSSSSIPSPKSNMAPTTPVKTESSTSTTNTIIAIPITPLPGALLYGGDVADCGSAKDFSKRFEIQATQYGWDDAMKIQNFPLYLTSTAKKWHSLFMSDHKSLQTEPTWAGCLTAFQTAFKSHLTEEELESKLRNRKKNFAESIEDYYYSVLKLCNRLDKNMPDERKVKYLLKGLSHTTAVQIFNQHPTRPSDVMDLLRRQEKLACLLGYDSELFVNTISTRTPVPSADDLARQMREMQGKVDSTYSTSQALAGAENSEVSRLKFHIKSLQQKLDDLKIQPRKDSERPSRSGNNHFRDNSTTRYPSRERSSNSSRERFPSRDSSRERHQSLDSSRNPRKAPDKQYDEKKYVRFESPRPQNSQPHLDRTPDGKPICRYCRKPGHFLRDCRTRKRNEPSGNPNSQSDWTYNRPGNF